jgi:hypothetical protein
MKVQKVKIEDVKPNPNNPRVIRDEKFKKLVKSLEEFPDMMQLRPIVVDENKMVLGGNMRLKAAKAAGIEEVWIMEVELDETKTKEFIVKDNVNYGNWDYLLLKDYDALEEWGMVVPSWATSGEADEEGDDFFNDEFFNTQNEEGDEQPEEPTGDNSSQTTYLLLMLETEDYIFMKKMESELFKKTATNNISDAIYKIIVGDEEEN